MNEVAEYLKNCGTFYLATSENGQAHVRRFGDCKGGPFQVRAWRPAQR